MVFNPSRESRVNTAGQVTEKLCIVTHVHLFKSGTAFIYIEIVFIFDFILCFSTLEFELEYLT